MTDQAVCSGMHLTHLSLTNFRLFSRLDVDMPGGVILLVGDNAQGKTSILEAIYYLATFVSFQATNERQLIHFWAPREPLAVAKIIADFQRPLAPTVNSRVSPAFTSLSGSHRLEVRLILQEPSEFNQTAGLKKELLLDNVPRKAGEIIGAFNAVLFLPQMLRMIEGAPEERRRFLNQTLSQALPHYAQALTKYGQILSRRNALLKQLAENGGDLSQLDFWDKELSESGAMLIHARIQAIQELERLAARIHRELTRGQEVLRLAYQPSFEPYLVGRPQQYSLPLDAPIDRSGLSLERIQQVYLECLLHSRAEEIERGMTLLGPHRDEVRFLANKVDLGIYGSRGQARTAMLSLKLAEVAWMKERTGQWPVLLLDEVLAELDLSRRVDLLSRLAEVEQAVLTTTDLELFPPEFIRQWKIARVQGGCLSL